MPISRFVTISDLDLVGKRVLVRVDFNVPIEEGDVKDDTRIRATLPTLQQLLDAQAKVIVVSHLSRPEEGKRDKKNSLAPVARQLSKLMGQSVPLINEWSNGVAFNSNNLVLLENIRFEIGEKINDDGLARHMASLCDVYVNDAFATAHRAQASTSGVAKYAPIACAGPLLLAEISALSKAMQNPSMPMVAIVGGAKISTKLTVLEFLLNKVDRLIVGGGIGNTLLKAKGYNIGQSLNEPELISVAENLLVTAEKQNKEIPLPSDVVCAKRLRKNARATTKPITEIEDDDMILDIGPETAKHYSTLINEAKTIVWSGPLGVFEYTPFSYGTQALAEAIAKSDAYSIAGGGDTLAAISKFGVVDKISYISTGGGAFLEFIEGRELPAIAILEESARAWYSMERAREF